MNNFIHLNNTNDELVYISISFPNYGRLKYDYCPMAAEIFYNELLDSEFYLDLEKKAIQISASASIYDFNFSLICLKNQLKECIDAYKKMLNMPIKSELIQSKIKNYFLIECNDFDNLAYMKLFENFFGSGFINSKYGNFDNFCEITFKNYIKNLKNQSNKIVVTANKNQLDEISTLLNPCNNNIYETLEYQKSFFEKEFKNTNQAFIRFCSPCKIANKKEKSALMLIGFILGGGFGSRITEEIRVKRGLAYSAFAFFRSLKETSYISGYLQTKLSSENEAIKIVKDEFSKLLKDGINESEFLKAKNFLINSNILKYSTVEKRHNIACDEIFSNYELGESKNRIQILKTLKLEECNEILKSKKEINDLSFFVVSKNA